MVVPCIGAGVDDGLVPGRALLALRYADHVNYPFVSDRDDLAKIAQFHAMTIGRDEAKCDFLDFMKTHLWNCAAAGLLSHCSDAMLVPIAEELEGLTFSALAARLGWADSLEIREVSAYDLLADFPLPIYITTNYHSFMEMALQRADKKPRTKGCWWHGELDPSLPSLFRVEDDYLPSVAEPLVYHLHGLDQYPSSLALVEDDYSELWIAAEVGRGRESQDVIPNMVKEAAGAHQLMLLGYQFDGRDFENLRDVLIRPYSRNDAERLAIVDKSANERERAYLRAYLPRDAGRLAIMDTRDEQTNDYISRRLQGFTVQFAAPEQFLYQLSTAWHDKIEAS